MSQVLLPTPKRRSAETATKPPEQPSSPGGRDLMRNRYVAAVLRSRLYPRIIQIPVAAVFGLVAFELLAGPQTAHDNAGTALMWVLWWPVIPLVFLLLGRIWCAVCPFAWISDTVQKLVGANQPVPQFLKRYGIWIIDASFLVITWADHVWGVVGSPWGSGVLLLLLTTAVIISGAFFQRRTFCRYLCFLGGLAGNYSRTGMVELRADQDICKTCTSRAACYNGTDAVAPCPLFTFPRTMDSTANCNLCANCIKSCPNDAIQVRLRKPTSELWFIRRPRIEESFLAMAIMGIVIIQNLTMLEVWDGVLGWIRTTTGITSTPVVFTFAFIVAVGLPVGLLYLAATLTSRGDLAGAKRNFARFGYALIPLDIAGHIAHNLFHLLAEGGSVWVTVAAVFGVRSDASVALASPLTIQVLQFALLGLGILASLYAMRRIANSGSRIATSEVATAVPFAALIVLLGAANVWMFTQPMMHRM